MWIFKWFLLFLVALPILMVLTGQILLARDYRTANRDSAKIAPDPKQTPEAVVQVYAARALDWRGIFAVHTWIAIKPENAATYTVHQVVGWRVRRGLGRQLATWAWFLLSGAVVLFTSQYGVVRKMYNVAETNYRKTEAHMNRTTAFLIRAVLAGGIGL